MYTDHIIFHIRLHSIPQQLSCWGMMNPKVLWYIHEQTLHCLDMDKEQSPHPTKVLLKSQTPPRNISQERQSTFHSHSSVSITHYALPKKKKKVAEEVGMLEMK